MQDIEAAVGEDHAASIAFLAAKPQNRFVQSKNRRTIQRISMQAQRRKRKTLPETVVYHAHTRRRPRGEAGQCR
jgi:hypothetical protein